MIGWIVLAVIVLFLGICFYALMKAQKAEQAKVAAMDPAEREIYVAERTARAEAARQARIERHRAAVARRKLDKGKVAISTVGKADGQPGLACPKCGGAQFKARRSTAARATIGAATVATGGIAGLGAAAVTRQKQVQCVTCGAKYMRG